MSRALYIPTFVDVNERAEFRSELPRLHGPSRANIYIYIHISEHPHCCDYAETLSSAASRNLDFRFPRAFNVCAGSGSPIRREMGEPPKPVGKIRGKTAGEKSRWTREQKRVTYGIRRCRGNDARGKLIHTDRVSRSSPED